jgi:hypothetical protein
MRKHGSQQDEIPKDFTLVTVSVDRVDFLNKLHSSCDLKLKAYVLNASGSTLII